MLYHNQTNKYLVSALMLSVLTACSTISKSPSDANVTDAVTVKQPLPPLSYPYYRVKAGDTLYSIAMRNDKDYKELGRLNKLDEKYTIYVDQKLVLEDENAPATKTQAVETSKIVAKPLPVTKPTPNTVTEVKKPTDTVVKTAPSVGSNVQDTVKNGSLTWTWPMSGTLLKRFSTEGVGSKGIDIAGKRGDIVKAAADGVVVYAGEGLVGYGKLLIVRHNDEYISAYAHNDRLIATEGQKIKLGQTIAEVGSTGTDKEKLHFEIRYKGKPIDPLTILPK
ncbi:MAG: peptidoglycan DD-metalloendopeptidase family protein [Moraxellaceae bacterium]|nr:peptidoglycan DD-metalloendopeptidase family protein [Pseudomonadales bacterium]MCP5175729.1 peptidoglycan DD-metalloendopeptidase family protein [Moraxellaceae bacterium]MCP5178033.1 peptidoglycan DD-metalloendopeptidase family protein [Moraxellaceae bacterium]HQV21712.1 peptidoglycan DD-metalloendopeptidase family protein [Agitococcus sp.]